MTLHPIFQNIFEAHGMTASGTRLALRNHLDLEAVIRGERSAAQRKLNETYKSFFAPEFRALENYAAVEPNRTLSEVLEAGRKVVADCEQNEIKLAAELAERRGRGSHPSIIDEWTRALASTRAHREYVEGVLSGLDEETETLAAAE